MDAEMLETVRYAGSFLRTVGKLMKQIDKEEIDLDFLYLLQDNLQTVNQTLRLAIQNETEERSRC